MSRRTRRLAKPVIASLLVSLAVFGPTGCGRTAPEATGEQRPGGRGGSGWGPGAGGSPASGGRAAAVPVEAAVAQRRSISSFIETNGTLEAENEVDLVARVAAPVLEIAVEEGMSVRQGQLLARLDDREIRAQLDVVRVQLEEAERALRRAEALSASHLVSPEELDAARSRYEGLSAQLASSEIQLGYTRVTAPFGGLVVARYVHLAEQVSVNAPLLRISDFDPLLCPIQVPERELQRLRVGLRAYIEVEAYSDQRFSGEVLRIRPVVDAATGTVKVTLQVAAGGKLRPGMFARAFVEVETRPDALVIPKAALSLESIGDTLFVVGDGVAERREVELGFSEGDVVEVLEGLAEGERVVVVGQDGLSDGTPIQVLDSAAPSPIAGASGGGPFAPGFDPSQMSEEQRQQMRERMRSRGLSEEQIEQRLQQMADGGGPGEPGPGGRAAVASGRRPGAAGAPADAPRPSGEAAPAAAAGPGSGRFGGSDFDPSRLSEEQKERLRKRLRERGLSEEEIERRLSGGGSGSGE